MDSGLGFIHPMFFIGVVENRDDPRAEGRVQVRAFGVHGSNQDIPTDQLPWATLILGHHDVNFTPPPLNAWVFGFFIDGRDAQQPMILGLIPSQTSELIDPETKGWGAIPAENYDRHLQGSRARDLGLSPMSKLATGEFLNETYNEALETNRVRNIPIAGGCARGHNAVGNGNIWSNDIGETDESVSNRTLSSANDLLSLLDRVEASGNYNALLGFSERPGRRFSGINISSKTIDDLIAFSSPGGEYFQWSKDFKRENNIGNPNLASTPMGRYQIVGTTLRSLKVRLNLTGKEVFSSSLQDRMFQTLLDDRLRGQSTIEGKIRALRNEWEGFTRVSSDELAAAIRAYESGKTGPSLLENPEELSRIERLNRADEIRTQIAAIDRQLESLGYGGADAEARKALEEQKVELERELARLEGSNATEGTSNEPYSGYATPSRQPGCVSSWEEPPSGYSAQYPFNRVIETASGHSIELDDSPGGERIMIWHRDGSYIQITGTSTTHKNMSDAYHVNERNHHVYIGGNNIVTIEGDSYVLVKGNKIEEIEGNYKQIVHGNVMIGSAGRVEINGADRTDIRSASLGLDSNVENLNIRTGKNIVFESGDSINLSSKNIRIGASENMSVSGQKALFLEAAGGDVHIKSDGNVLLNPSQNLFLTTKSGNISIQSKGNLNMNSDSFVAIKSTSSMNIRSDAHLLLGSGETINMNAEGLLALKSEGMFLNSSAGDLNIKVGNNLNTETTQMNMKAGTAYIESDGALDLSGEHVKLGGGEKVSIDATVVAIDDIVLLASGDAVAPESIQANVDEKEPVDPAEFDFVQDDSAAAADALPAETPIGAATVTGPGIPPDRTLPKPIALSEGLTIA
jgi:uncharacterized protein (DUF2345 family)/DNA-binding transcriptional MerR regulator